MRYLCQVVYVPGEDLAVADTLSRSPVDKGDGSLVDEVEEYVHSIASVWPLSDYSRGDVSGLSTGEFVAGLAVAVAYKCP